MRSRNTVNRNTSKQSNRKANYPPYIDAWEFDVSEVEKQRPF